MEVAINNLPELPRLVFFGGYSGSGKTTYCTPILEELGYVVHSTSRMNHEYCDRFVREILGASNFDSYDRNTRVTFRTLVGKTGERICSNKLENKLNKPINKSKESEVEFGSRELLIDVAEKALVPVFSRTVFVNAIADKIIASCSDVSNGHNDEKRSLLNAVELFSAEEYSLLLDRLYPNRDLSASVVFNLRRYSERKNVDSRTLLPLAKDIANNEGYAALKIKIVNHLVADPQYLKTTSFGLECNED